MGKIPFFPRQNRNEFGKLVEEGVLNMVRLFVTPREPTLIYRNVCGESSLGNIGKKDTKNFMI